MHSRCPSATQDLGLTIVRHRRKLLDAIAALNTAPPSAPVAPPRRSADIAAERRPSPALASRGLSRSFAESRAPDQDGDVLTSLGRAAPAAAAKIPEANTGRRVKLQTVSTANRERLSSSQFKNVRGSFDGDGVD
jgi:hypothetical protein